MKKIKQFFKKVFYLNQGLTLVELLVVLGIIAAVGGIGAIEVDRVRDATRDKAIVSYLAFVHSDALLFQRRKNTFENFCASPAWLKTRDSIIEQGQTPICRATLNHFYIKVPLHIQGYLYVDHRGRVETIGELALAPELYVSPTEIRASLEKETDWTTIETINVTNLGRGILDWSATDDQDWLSIIPSRGITAVGETDYVDVRVNTTGLHVGTHIGTITFTAIPPATGSPDDVSIVLEVTYDPDPLPLIPPELYVSPTEIRDSLEKETGWTTIRTIDVTNLGGGVLDWSVTDDQDWLSIVPSRGITAVNETDYVDVMVHTIGLSVGSYEGAITFTGVCPLTGSPAKGSPSTVTVVLEVTYDPDPPPPLPELYVSPTKITGSLKQDVLDWTDIGSVNVTNPGGGILEWFGESDNDWLRISPTSETTTTEVDVVTIQALPPFRLGPGTYEGTIAFTPNIGSPDEVIVELTVEALKKPPELYVSPTEINITLIKGTGWTDIGTVNVTNPGGGILAWHAIAESIGGWLKIAPDIGTVVDEIDSVTVQVNAIDLEVGDHFGAIAFLPNIGDPKPVVIALTVEASPPTVSIWADPISIDYNSTTTIYWTSEHTTSCYWREGFGWWRVGRGAPLEGSRQTAQLTSDTTFTLECTGPGGTASDSVTVQVVTAVCGNDDCEAGETPYNCCIDCGVPRPWCDRDVRVMYSCPDPGTTPTKRTFNCNHLDGCRGGYHRDYSCSGGICTMIDTFCTDGCCIALRGIGARCVDGICQPPPVVAVCGNDDCEPGETPHNCCSDCGVPASRCIFGTRWVERWWCPAAGTTPVSERERCRDLNRCVNGVTLVYGCRNARCVHIENTCEHGCCVEFCRGFGTGWDGRCVGDSCRCEQRTR